MTDPASPVDADDRFAAYRAPPPATIPGAEKIVRRLADGDAPYDSRTDICALCGVSMPRGEGWSPDLHKGDCLWRLAHEWVARHG